MQKSRKNCIEFLTITNYFMISEQVDHCHSSLFRQKEKEVKGTTDKEQIKSAETRYKDHIYAVLVNDTCPRKQLVACISCNKPMSRF